MSVEDFKKHMRRGAVVAASVIASATAVNASASNPKKVDAVKEKTEYTVNTVDLYGIAKLEQIKQEDGVYTEIAGQYYHESEFDRKDKLKEWKEEEKEAFSKAEPIQTDTVALQDAEQAAVYDPEDKGITINHVEIPEDQSQLEEVKQRYAEKHPEMSADELNKNFSSTMDWLKEVQNPETVAHKSVLAHEKQHKSNDELGIYAPGLSPEQYAIICQYDELSASVAELSVYISSYQEKLSSGMSKEEALKVFDNNKEFAFYRDALEKGLDPDSKEGKKLLVQGTYDMWKNNMRQTESYREQITNVGIANISTSDVATASIGDEAELRKRINKIFENISVSDTQGGERKLGNLSQYLPEEIMPLDPAVKEKISSEFEKKTGLSPTDRENLHSSLGAKKDKKKIRDLIKILTGRKRPEQVGGSKEGKGGKEIQNSNTTTAVSMAMRDKLDKTY